MKVLHLLAPLLLVSCLPSRLVPLDYSIEENNLEALALFDSVAVSLTNLEIKNDHFVFGLGVQNNGPVPIFIDTDKMLKFAHHQSYQDTAHFKAIQEVIPAMSPQQVSQFFRKKKRNADAAAALLFLVGAAITTYDAVQDIKDNSKEQWTEEDEQKSVTRDAVAATTLLATDIFTEVAFTSGDRAATELEFLPDELFDRKVIEPGEAYYGKVFFRRVGEVHRYHRIQCPYGEEELIFDFRKASPRERRFLFENGY